eukprot:m.154478 g.154478  ORF g.154478 m.154478 type:complete len:1188 (+) comp30891_c0_seq1:197-3760(+)
MYIKRVILDGFKSYANRTVVDNFDPEFNAITGLNGSGKSNILDSICFVLGITNLSQVRAKTLQELVYKNGQAGVTKASVSIVFDNTNKDQSPVGYADQDEITVTRQVVIGGKNKYLINGHTAQKGRVENFFHSVQLNVNNPHFLIMQGRITKVLNMKPREILSMIEEAAGTRMYETKKATSLQTMEKKSLKMNEIERMLKEEIQPTLEKLRNERSAFFEWQKNKMEIDRLKQLVIAYQYMQMEELLLKSKEEMKVMEEQVEEKQQVAKECEVECVECEKNIAQIEEQRSDLLAGDLKSMEEEANELSKKVVKSTEKFKSKKADLKTEQDNVKATEKSLQAAKDSIPKQEKAIAKAKALATESAGKYQEALSEQEKAELKLNAVAMGMSTEDGAEAKLRIEHQQPLLKKKKTAAKDSEKEHSTMVKTLEVTGKEIAAIQKKMDALDFSEERETELEGEKERLQSEIRKYSDQIDRLSSKMANMEFSYSDPEKNFDRSKVSGLVAELITVKDPKAMTALEISAGGRLYNVVVDTEKTAKQLLQNGKLRRRVTIIPLNKINPRGIKPEAIKHAEKLVGADKASVALSLVGYAPKVEAAMKYVFGANFICPDMNVAKQVTFNNNIRTKSVTLDGDVMDPSGTLTGGSRPNTAPILAQLHELKKAKAIMAELQVKLAAVNDELNTLRKSSSKYAELKAVRDIKEHENGLAKSRIEQSSCHQVVAEIKELEVALQNSEETLKTAKAEETAMKKKLISIEKEMKQAKDEKDSLLKAAEKNIVTAKQKVQKAKDAHKKAEQAVEEAELENEALKTEVVSIEEQLKVLASTVADVEKEVEVLQATLVEVKNVYEERNLEAKEHRDKVSDLEKKIEGMQSKIVAANKKSSKSQLELKKLNNAIVGFEKKKKEAAAAVNSLLEQYAWIEKDREYFGKEGTMYAFSQKDAAKDPRKFKTRLDTLVEAQDKLSKTVNTKVMSMFDTTEKSASDLIKKKKIVEADKAKIAQAIQELDQKKNETLQKAFKQVNRDFGSIFSTLLPGTKAELGLTETKNLLDGLQVRVAFGAIWKESLTELSGGQRSLVALSLILSLLLFKPAPLYILDEIDAALDLSHTQNIGQMLKAHFKQSQFVVVSLKEGMFNNANVLFKTAFVDGVSTVRRNAQSRSAIENSGSKENAKPTKRANTGRSKAKGISNRN